MVDIRQSPSGEILSVTSFGFQLIQADVTDGAVSVAGDSDTDITFAAGAAVVFMPGDIFLPVFQLSPDITSFSNYRYRVRSLNPGPGILLNIRNTINVALGPNAFTWRFFALRAIP